MGAASVGPEDNGTFGYSTPGSCANTETPQI
jgi:hypothetical protein